MAVKGERILKEATGLAEDVAARSKKLYEEAVDRLPEGSAPYVGLALGGIVLAAGSFFIGRSRKHEERVIDKVENISKDFDFKPFYRLARLWLIARMVD